MTTEAPTTAATPPSSNTRSLGVEVDSYTPPGLSSVDLPLPGKDVSVDYVPVEAVAEAPAAAPTEAKDEKPEAVAVEEPAKDDAATEEGETPTEDEAVPAKLDLEAYQTEFAANGVLSDETYSSIEKATGFDRPTIDSVISAMKERQDRNTERWDGMMGGAENKQAIVDWARENWSAEQQAAYNAALDSKDMAKIDLAIQGLVAAAKEAGVSTTAVVKADTSALNLAQSEAGGYKSQDDYRADIRSPKYKRDPSYRAAVQAKLRASAWWKSQSANG